VPVTDPRRPDVFDVILAPALVFAGYAIAPLASRLWLGVAVSLLAIAASIPFLVRRARLVRVSHTPALDALRVIAVFGSVLIVAFASLHYAVATHVADQYTGIATKLDSVYYTVTMLSTVGFGDITADGQLARLLATLNILFNLIALGIGIRLVTHAAQTRVHEQGTRLVPPSADEA
jgi:voltage-gated potassium channel